MFSAFMSKTRVYLTENSMRNVHGQPLKWPRKSDFALCAMTMACEEEEEEEEVDEGLHIVWLGLQHLFPVFWGSWHFHRIIII